MAKQTSGEELLSALSGALADAAEKAGAAIVQVKARPRLPATGIVYQADLILTADHVVEQDDEIKVLLADGSEQQATLVGRDPGSDLALLRLKQGGATPAEAAQQPARIGQLVLALGRPTQEGIQASIGVVSAIGGPVRTGRGGVLERYLRTDTTPYPGFSGGPLVDAAGRVVGINTSGFGGGGSITIPAAQAWQVAQQLSQHGKIRRGYLGVRSQQVELPQHQQQTLGRQQTSGLLIIWLEQGSPADQAGLLIGDILIGVDGQQLGDADDLQSAIGAASVGQQLALEVLRGGQLQTIPTTIGERK